MWRWLKLFFFITVLMLGSGTMTILYRAQAQDEMSDEEDNYGEEGAEETAVEEPASAATAAPTPAPSLSQPAAQEAPASTAAPAPVPAQAAEPAALTPPSAPPAAEKPAPPATDVSEGEGFEEAGTETAPPPAAPAPALPAEKTVAPVPAAETSAAEAAGTEKQTAPMEPGTVKASETAPVPQAEPPAAGTEAEEFEGETMEEPALAGKTETAPVPQAEPPVPQLSAPAAGTEAEEFGGETMEKPASAGKTETAPVPQPSAPAAGTEAEEFGGETMEKPVPAGKTEIAPVPQPPAPAAGTEAEEYEGETVEEPAPAGKTETAPAPAAPSAAEEPETGAEEEELGAEPESKTAPGMAAGEPEAGEFEPETGKPAESKEEKAAKEEKPAAESEEELSEEEEFLKEEAEGGGEKAPKGKKPEKAAGEVQPEEEGWTEEWGGEEAEQPPKEEMPEAETAQKIPNILTTLEDCKRVALMNDRRIQVALKQIKYERFKIQEAERAFLPGLKGTFERQEGNAASTQTTDSGAAGPDTTFKGLKYGLEGEQILFNGGKLIYTLKQAKNNLEVAKKKYYQARQELIFKVEKAYYTLVKAQMVFEVQADLSKDAESALSFSREAYRQGLNSYHEFLNVQSQTDQTYYQLLSHQQEITLGELGLRQACNIDASIGLQIDAVLTFTDFNFNYSLDECLELAFKNRPDLAVNELTTLSDLYGIKLSMAEGMPKIQLTANVGKNGQATQDNQGLDLTDESGIKLEATWVLGANTTKYTYERKKQIPNKIGVQDNTKDSLTHKAEVSLFDKIEVFSNTAKSQVQQATSEADYIELRGKVANELEENYFNYQKAMTMVTASLSKIKFREKDLEVNRAKQMMDEIPLSQVLTSELQLGEERINYVGALADYYIAISGLFKAMGLAK